MKSDKIDNVMVFGTFDLLHDGHRHFLTEAKKLGRLTAVVARDSVAKKLKGLEPVHNLEERMKNLVSLKIADEVIQGDENVNTWVTLTDKKPDIVALGYDQTRFKNAISNFIAEKKLPIRCVVIGPHKDETLHSSRLRKLL